MDDFRIAVACHDPKILVAQLSRELGLEFEGRDSSYLGEYWTELPKRTLRILYNSDPMYMVGVDPPEDRFFEAGFPRHGVLVDGDGCSIGEQVAAAILAHFPDSRIVEPSS